jgi:hypothetical protein
MLMCGVGRMTLVGQTEDRYNEPMRALVRFSLCLLLFGVVGCSSSGTHTLDVGGQKLTFELPREWRAVGKMGNWSDGESRQLHFAQFSEPESALRQKTVQAALKCLEGDDLFGAREQLKKKAWSRHMAPESIGALQESREKMDRALQMLSEPTPDVEASRVLLLEVRDHLDIVSNDLEGRAMNYHQVLQSDNANLQLEKTEPLLAGGNSAFVVDCRTEGGEEVDYLYYSSSTGDCVFVDRHKLDEGEILRNVAATLNLKASNLDADKPTQSRRRNGSSKGSPEWVYFGILIVLFSGLPAAFGASTAFSAPRHDKEEFLKNLSRTIALPTGVGTFLLAAVVGIWTFSQILQHSGGVNSPMAGIVLFFSAIAAVVGALLVSVLAAFAGGFGARMGAPRGKAASVWGAAIGATAGAAALPIILSLQ